MIANAARMTLLLILAILNAAYVAALPSATIFYVANMLLHVGLGVAAAGLLIWRFRRSPRALPFFLAALLGLYLTVAGATFDHRAILWLHIALAIAGIAILLPRWTPALGLAFTLALAL